jgi:LPXTG-motif cell wall-anchored protein
MAATIARSSARGGPGGPLPETGGGNTGVLAAVGVGLVLGGVTLLLVTRRTHRKGI